MNPLALWLIVFTIERSIASKHRSVNLALETVLEFDKPDDVKVVDKVQDFLTRVQHLLNRDQKNNFSARRKKSYQFSDLVENVITEINYLEDEDLREMFNIINKSIQKSRSNDVLDDNARKYLSDKLIEIRDRPIVDIRSSLDDLLRELKNGKKTKSNNIINFINTLYERNTDDKLSRLVKRLNLFRRSGRRSKIDLKNIIDKVINDVIYEHYNNLEGNERRHVKKHVRSFFANAIPSNEKLEKKESESVSSETSNEEQAIEIKPELINQKKTKKISTHITLYPKTVKVKSLERHKFRTGRPWRKIPPEDVIEDYAIDNKFEKIENVATADTNEIHTNHSVEINVNLMLKGQNSQKNKYNHRVKTTKHKRKISQRASTKKSKIYKKHRKTTFAVSSETFGSLYKKTHHDRDSQDKLSTNGQKSTAKERILRTVIDFDTKETSTGSNFDERRRKIINSSRKGKTKTTHKNTIQPARRVDRPITIKHHTTKAKTISTPSKTKFLLTLTSSQDTIVTTTKVASPPITITATTTTESDILNELEDNFTGVKMSEGLENITNATMDTTFMDLNNTLSNATENFDVDEFIKKSEVLNIENEAKRRNIEERMREDFKFLLSSPTPSTTEKVIDVLKELEDAFKI